MTGRTHDLAAFTTLSLVFVTVPIPEMTLATAIAAFGANFIGGLFPDIDQPTSDLWDNFRGGELVGKVTTRFLGGHRHISHSIIGVVLIGLLADMLLGRLASIILIDMMIVWWSFMIGVVSHIATDMLTKEGVPLLWPLKWRIGIPPVRFFRIKAGGWIENVVLFPFLLILNGYIFYLHQDKFIQFFHSLRSS